MELIGRGIGINPNQASFHSNYGAALLSLGRFAEAEASLRRAITLRPDYADVLANLGMAQVALGNDAAAEASLRCAGCQAWHRDATARLAKLLQRQRRFDEAGKLLEATLAAAPCQQFQLALGYLRYAEGKAEEAAEEFWKVLVGGAGKGERERGRKGEGETRIHASSLRTHASSLRTHALRSGRGELEGGRHAELACYLGEHPSPRPSPGNPCTLTPCPSPGGEGSKRIAFVSPHCVLDFTNGAATATLDGLKLLSSIGFQCEAFCGTRMDSWEHARIEDVLRERGRRYEVRNLRIPASPQLEATSPHPNPLPEGEGTSCPHRPPLRVGAALNWRRQALTLTLSRKERGLGFYGRMIFTSHADVPVTMVDTEEKLHALTPAPLP